MKSINRIAKHLATKSESEGLEGWTASKLTMAEDYLQVVNTCVAISYIDCLSKCW